jgi:hypothetical protein
MTGFCQLMTRLVCGGLASRSRVAPESKFALRASLAQGFTHQSAKLQTFSVHSPLNPSFRWMSVYASPAPG